MTTIDRSAMPAAWYPCPVDPARLRWWDGGRWTEHTADPSEVALSGEAPGLVERAGELEPQQQQPESQPAPEPHDEYAGQSRAEYRQHRLGSLEVKPTTTPWIWLFVAVPVVQAAVFIGLVALDPGLALSLSFGLATLGYLVAALLDASVLADRDHRTVGWAWGLMPPGYFILRLLRVGRSSIAPFAVWVVVQAAALAVVTMVTLPLYAQMNTAAEYDGEPAAGASTEPLTTDERAAMLTPAGMSAKILADLRGEGSVVNQVTCPEFPAPTDAAHITCRVEMEYAAADVDVQVTDNYPNVAFVVLRFAYDQ